MRQELLFIQGGGSENGYEADKILVDSLQSALTNYQISYPKIQTDESAPNFGWTKQIASLIAAMKDDFILAGHSFGASMILRCLSEQVIEKKIAGIFLLASPFWSGKEDWGKGLQLPQDAVGKLVQKASLFFYHCRDDEEISFSHLALYRQKFPFAIFRELPVGGHQFNTGLTVIAHDIQSISNGVNIKQGSY